MLSSATIIAFLLKNWWKIGLGLFVAVTLSVVALKVHGYLKHVADVEAQNKSLTTDNATLTAQKAALVKLNADNQKTYQTELAQAQQDHQIASDEQAATTKRDSNYKDIHHAIDTAPPSAAPVDPVISNTLDSLWGNSQAAQ